MAWTDVSTGDKVEAAHINDIHQALNGTVGKAQPMAFTEVDEIATYALDVRNKDATNSLIARFRNAANEVVLSIVKEAVNTAKQIVSTVADGTAPFVVNSTTKVDNLHVETAAAVDADAIDGDAIADDAVDSEHIAAGAIDLAHMSANSVDSDQYVDGSIDRVHLAADIIDGTKIADGAVDSEHIADDAIDSQHYANGSIDTAHLANDAVDDTKVGNRVPQFYRRQGGSATNWNTAGTTTYTPGAVRMQAGSKYLSVAPSYTAHTTLTFPQAFSGTPLILLTPESDLGVGGPSCYAFVEDVTATTAELWVTNNANAVIGAKIHWLAIGPE